MVKPRQTFMVEDATILFRNFAGNEKQYNEKGDRNFCVVLSEEQALDLQADGWNVKRLKDREDQDTGDVIVGDYYIKVTVGYKGRPPEIVLITSRAQTNVSEDMVETLDYVQIAEVDLICNAYHWESAGMGEGHGITAYLKSLYITVDEDYLKLKYTAAEDQIPGSG